MEKTSNSTSKVLIYYGQSVWHDLILGLIKPFLAQEKRSGQLNTYGLYFGYVRGEHIKLVISYTGDKIQFEEKLADQIQQFLADYPSQRKKAQEFPVRGFFIDYPDNSFFFDQYDTVFITGQRQEEINNQQREGINDQQQEGINDQRQEGINDQQQEGINNKQQEVINDHQRKNINDHHRENSNGRQQENINERISECIISALGNEEIEREMIYTFMIYMQLGFIKAVYPDQETAGEKIRILVHSLAKYRETDEEEETPADSTAYGRELSHLFENNKHILAEILAEVWNENGFAEDISWMEEWVSVCKRYTVQSDFQQAYITLSKLICHHLGFNMDGYLLSLTAELILNAFNQLIITDPVKTGQDILSKAQN